MVNINSFGASTACRRQSVTPLLLNALRFLILIVIFGSAASELCLGNFRLQNKLPVSTAAAPPRNLQVSARKQIAVLSWQAPLESRAVGYVLYRSENETVPCDRPPYKNQISGTLFNDSAVTAGNTYRYAVKAIDAKRAIGACSNIVTVFIPQDAIASSASAASISIYPTTVTLQELQSQRFIARINYRPYAQAVWSLSPANSVGTLSQIGNYRAPNVINAPRTITITASVPGNPAQSASAVIQLVGGAPTSEFIGDSDSLRPYRQTLTEQEVRHTLRKVALGGSPDLVTIGTQQGITALSDALTNCVEGPELKQQAINSLGQDPRSIYWHMAATRQYWFYFLVHGCGLQEQMALHLHNWFAADGNKDDGTFFYYARPTQVDLFRDHGLGNFQDLLMKIHFDMTENHMLDNRYNSKWNVNENYGREFLELLTTGTKDLNGQPIYDERTMHDVARSMTGFNENWRHPTGSDPPFVNGDYSYVYFDPERWDSDPKTVFGSTQSFNYETLTNHILYNTPYARRYVAGKLFALLAHPNPSPAIVEELSRDLLKSHYDLKPVIRKIINSEAFYSREAKCGCVVSSAEWLISLIRTTNLPVTDRSTWQSVNDTFYSSGHLLLEPSSVFGWSTCGVNRNNIINHGEQWINSSVQLARLNGINNLLNEVYYHESFNWNSLLPNPQASAEEVVRHFERIFNTSFSDDERAKIVEYLNTDYNGNSGSTTAHLWDPADQTRVRAKLNGLIQIFGAGLDFNQN